MKAQNEAKLDEAPDSGIDPLPLDQFDAATRALIEKDIAISAGDDFTE